jgi:hypothetical protein
MHRVQFLAFTQTKNLKTLKYFVIDNAKIVNDDWTLRLRLHRMILMIGDMSFGFGSLRVVDSLVILITI